MTHFLAIVFLLLAGPSDPLPAQAEDGRWYTESEASASSHPWTNVTAELWRFNDVLDTTGPWYVWPMLLALAVVLLLIGAYTVRHYWFTFNRLYGTQRHAFVPVDEAVWPEVTVLVPAHNEETVISNILDALLDADYPQGKLRIMPVNDRSQDGTRAILDEYAYRHHGRITPFHRTDGKPGKAAALNDAGRYVTSEIILIFDADYVPGRDVIKQLVAPFFDPETGAVMGRVVPMNAHRNFLTRILDMERSGGYQVDQQARMNLGLVACYGGTVGGVRRSALNAIGGWRDDTLAEDTDITFRLLNGGWRVVYSNRYECYEEVPENWPVRIRQLTRWAQGHTESLLRYTIPTLRARHLSKRERFDAMMLLGVYLMSPVLLFGWCLAIALFYLGINPVHGLVAFLAVASYNTVGNFAVFYEIAAAVRLDGSSDRVRLLPLNILGFLVNMITVSRATFRQMYSPEKGELVWHKTERFRPAPEPPQLAPPAYVPDEPLGRPGLANASASHHQKPMAA